MRQLLKAEPVFEPITLEELKRHTVVPFDEDDEVLVGFIEQARAQVEADTGRALVEQTWQLFGESFPDEIIVPKPPLVSVTSIKYIDTDGVEQTLAASEYQVLKTGVNARIKPASGKAWPSVQTGNYNGVTVEFVAGYLTDDGSGGFAGQLPHTARTALLVLAAHLYENREAMSPVQQYELPTYKFAISSLEVDLI